MADLAHSGTARRPNRSTFDPSMAQGSKGSGSDIDKIARNCGTSSDVIKRYYSKFLGVDQFDEDFTNIY